MNFKTFIKAVGTGPKGNRDLSFEESFESSFSNFKARTNSSTNGCFFDSLESKT